MGLQSMGDHQAVRERTRILPGASRQAQGLKQIETGQGSRQPQPVLGIDGLGDEYQAVLGGQDRVGQTLLIAGPQPGGPVSGRGTGRSDQQIVAIVALGAGEGVIKSEMITTRFSIMRISPSRVMRREPLP